MPGRLAATALLALGVAAFGTLLLGRLSHPLLWQDEGETAMFAQRVAEYGYPKVHGERNVVYEFGPNIAVGVKEGPDAYIGKTWADFYFAVPGLLWARASDDPYAKTFRLRLPFALLGALGVAAFLWAVWPAVPGGPTSRLGFAALYVVLCAASISLILHLREVRYYPLLVANLALVLGLHLRRSVYGTLGTAAYALAQALALVALFHVFFPAWFAAVVLLAPHAAFVAARAPGTRGERSRRVARALAPYALAAAAVAPAIAFFETFTVASRFSRGVGVSPSGYLANVAGVIGHFARHELLVPAALGRATALLPGASGGPPLRLARRTARALALFALGYVLLLCVNPLVYERYFVPLSPVATLVFLLDGAALLGEWPRRRALAATALGLAALASVGVRAGEIRGRIEEIRVPYRGPVDFIVAHIRERYPRPRDLVIATNYEAHPLMYYLGSRVIVGLALNDIAHERRLEPDVLIPRRRWPRSLVEVRRFLARGRYVPVELPVLDVHYNNVPSLSASPATPDVHRFRTPTPGPGARGLVLYERAPAASGARPGLGAVRPPPERATLPGVAQTGRRSWGSTIWPSRPATSRPPTSSTPGRWASSWSRSRSGARASRAGPSTSSTTRGTGS